jgi:hypothetical protein
MLTCLHALSVHATFLGGCLAKLKAAGEAEGLLCMAVIALAHSMSEYEVVDEL